MKKFGKKGQIFWKKIWEKFEEDEEIEENKEIWQEEIDILGKNLRKMKKFKKKR